MQCRQTYYKKWGLAPIQEESSTPDDTTGGGDTGEKVLRLTTGECPATLNPHQMSTDYYNKQHQRSKECCKKT